MTEPVRVLPPKIDWDEAITPEAIAYAQYTDPQPLCPTCGQPAIEGSLCTERNAKPRPTA